MSAGIDKCDINGRPAARVANPQFHDCMVGVETDARSRVDVAVNGLSGVDETCPIAGEVARLIEPRLSAASWSGIRILRLLVIRARCSVNPCYGISVPWRFSLS